MAFPSLPICQAASKYAKPKLIGFALFNSNDLAESNNVALKNSPLKIWYINSTLFTLNILLRTLVPYIDIGSTSILPINIAIATTNHRNNLVVKFEYYSILV